MVPHSQVLQVNPASTPTLPDIIMEVQTHLFVEENCDPRDQGTMPST